MKKIRINVNVPYDVNIGKGILEDSGKILKELNINGKLAIVCDTNVAPLYLDKLENSLKSEGYDTFHYVFPAGEESKNIKVLSDILEFFAESGLTRNDTAIALGGGVTGDMTGFAAGVYMRGISYAQIPTTLLACVDSSVGGKTAIDLMAGKNLAGLFIQPKTVICDVDTLKTLKDEIYADGMAEVIKTAILSSEELFEVLELSTPRENDEYIISKCVEYKGKIVSEDEFEKGVRKLLNLGHTPAHSIEKLTSYKTSHGQAVAIGLAIMTRASEKLGNITEDTCKRIIALIQKYALPVSTTFSAEELAKTSLYDKKRKGNTIDLINVMGIGNCTIDKTHVDKVKEIFEKGIR
ncbi:MAG: 3-dehydroquinate synthase [Ruminococcaceae bacterium]|nr:3-dehydroquinate synthase [Oscillospiraceae bacterium]